MDRRPDATRPWKEERVNDMSATSDLVVWRVRLICCGRDDGEIWRDTWEEADQFRQDYTSGAGVGDPQRPWHGGHIRAGIVECIGLR
jgi:hypothetical protein